MSESLFWADQEARRVIAHSGDKKEYVCASGITPSGTVHIGNFREIITVDLVVKALENIGKKVRFIYSWDDFDRLRKIPANFTKQEQKNLKEHLYEPVGEIPDPTGTHKTYARLIQKPLEEDVKELGIKPEFLYQHELFRKCVYAEKIRTALQKRERIRQIVNQYRKKPRQENWYPLELYCEKCNKGTTTITHYNEEYSISYKCDCGYENTIDFRKKGILKPLWRVDWPMRWAHYHEDFEPAGIDHFSAGSSRTTGIEIVNKIFDYKEPYGFSYDIITLKGQQKKMSKSKGNIISIRDAYNIYLPEIVRHMFAGTKPNRPFSISFDDDLLKIYDNFYKTERIAFGKEQVSKRDSAHWKSVYNYCYGQRMKKPTTLPVQPSFRQLSDTYQTFDDEKRTVQELNGKTSFDNHRLKQEVKRVKHWLENHAPKEYVYEITNKKPKLNKTEKDALKKFAELIISNKTEDEVKKTCKTIFDNYEIKPKKFFETFYLTLFGKQKGPRLAQYILAHDVKKISEIIKKLV
ncbi:MAG: lysine--tRNA ligase [Nanoarchaeota archaeon]|nr:lysine--tRNA ligase [Nanoarchaeota archaeon]